MKKWDRKYMSLEHPVVPESKEVFFKKKKRKSVDGGYVQRAQEPNQKASNSQIWNNLSNKLILDYNPKNKVSTC